MEEEEDMLRQRFSEDELERLRPSFTADATNDETFNDSAPAGASNTPLRIRLALHLNVA